MAYLLKPSHPRLREHTRTKRKKFDSWQELPNGGRRYWHEVTGVPHTEADYREVVELLDRVADEVGEDENHPLASLMDVLGVLIQKYEDENVPELTE